MKQSAMKQSAMKQPQPLRDYTPPSLPTFAEQPDVAPTLLERLPLRWSSLTPPRLAAVLACAGIAAGVVGSTGCAPTCHYGGSGQAIYVTRQTEQEVSQTIADFSYTQDELVFTLHHGGLGHAVYLVYFTEQEALGIIRARLAEAGIHLDEDIRYHNDIYWHEERDSSHGDFYAPYVVPDIPVKDVYVWNGEDFVALDEPPEAKAARITARPELTAKLNAQVDAFIEFQEKNPVS
jgi:hypothetical protein